MVENRQFFICKGLLLNLDIMNFLPGSNILCHAPGMEKKGMDLSQITGAASSYARKYALNGLFLIDDTKDADATNKGEEKTDSYNEAITLLEQAESVANVKAIWESYTDLHKNKEFIKAITAAKKQISMIHTFEQHTEEWYKVRMGEVHSFLI